MSAIITLPIGKRGEARGKFREGVPRRALVTAVACALGFWFSCLQLLPAHAAAAGASGEIGGTITLRSFVANPTGLQMGFFSGRDDAGMTADFGKRTMCRSMAANWRELEPKKGVYNFNHPGFASVRRAIEFGQTPNIGLGLSFEQSVPDFYLGALENPETQRAANNFIYALARHLLSNFGSCNLIIDGEVITALPITPQNKDAWAKWYVELARSARKAASDVGRAGQIKVMPVFNGNPFRNRITQGGAGAASNRWLREVVEASDYVGVDTYFFDPAKGVTDAEYTVRILKYWIDICGGGKDVIVQEHGFSTALGVRPGLKTMQAGTKYGGTEAQQAEYFKNLCNALGKANQAGGVLRNRLRGFMVYYYKDPPSGAERARSDDMFWKQHFGIVRGDGTRKPAFFTLRDGFRMLQDDPVLNPVKLASAVDVTSKWPVRVSYKQGTEYDMLRCVYPGAAMSGVSGACVLNIKTAKPGMVLVCVNGTGWLAGDGGAGTEHRVDVTQYVVKTKDGKGADAVGAASAGAETVIDLYFTGPKWPFEQEVLSVKLTGAK